MSELISYDDAIAAFDPAMADDRVYRVGAALETLLQAKWGGSLLDRAPSLEGATA